MVRVSGWPRTHTRWEAENAMKSRVTSLGLILFVMLGCSLDGEQKPRPSSGRNAEGQAIVPPGPGKYLAFDVLRQDYRRTTRYVLEITDPSGKITRHDFKKPRLVKRRTIMVPLPTLEPGAYTLVVIAEGPGGTSRSAPITYQVPVKKSSARSGEPVSRV
jgi:hypothetical protein